MTQTWHGSCDLHIRFEDNRMFGKRDTTKAETHAKHGKRRVDPRLVSLGIIAVGIIGVITIYSLPETEYQTARRLQRDADRMASAALDAETAAKEKIEARADACRSNKNAMTAFVMTQEPVKRSLKAPSSASFPYFSDKQVSVTTKPNCVFQVRGFVDAQNSFGAMLRNSYTAEIRFNEDGTWSLIGVNI